MGTPRVAFLGVCDRLNLNNPEHFASQFDIIGLRNHVAAYLYPLPINRLFFIFAVYDVPTLTGFKISLVDAKKKEIAVFTFSSTVIGPMTQTSSAAPPNPPEKGESRSLFMLGNKKSWTVIPTRISVDSAIIYAPDIHDVVLHTENGPQEIGWVNFGVRQALPLTPERIAAIKTSPLAAKTVEIQMGCKKCHSNLNVYTALERKPDWEVSGKVWYELLPDSYTCKCGNIHFDLRIMKQNMTGMLGEFYAGDGLSCTRLYENNALISLLAEFRKSLDTATCEEDIQKFIEGNPLVLSGFTPQKLFFKKPILAKHKTDFVVLTQNKTLLLIEIESPSTRLLKKDGGVSANLQHALDQVTDWLHENKRHHLAILDSLNLKPEEVATVKAVVIAGRDTPYAKEHLLKLKGKDFGSNVSFFTFDDLLQSVTELVRQVSRLK